MAEIIFNQKEHIGFLIINRPDRLNALNSKLLEKMCLLLDRIEKNQQIKVIVIRGEGKKSFIAGADITELEHMSSSEYRQYGNLFVTVTNKIMTSSRPVIAAVQGYAFGGGCYIATACDFIIATENSKFGQQEINLGFLGGTGLLPKLVGKHKAAEITMLGDVFDAAEAYRLGLLTKVVPEQHFESEILILCRKLLSKPSYALQFIKSSIRIALNTDIGFANSCENEMSSLCFDFSETKQLINKFINK